MASLRGHLRDVDPNRLFAVVPLPHAATTRIVVRQPQALVTPGAQVSDDLFEAWIWLFNTHQPAQGGVWVPHLGWVHTLIAPPTDCRPSPKTGGRERVAPPPRTETLRIPPYEGLAVWGSGTARSRGHNLTSLAARYSETTRAVPPPRERDAGTIAMILLENGHYYQVRIILHPQRGHSSFEAVDSMLLATKDLPDSPTPLLPDQPPDPLTAVVSGTAGTWHPGHALYCPWWWARRCWPHTRAWSAAWRFYVDGRQQLEAISEQTAETPTATNLCPVFAIHQIWALALGKQLQPAILTETEAQAAHVALVQKSSVPSAAPLCDSWVTLQGPEQQPATGPAAATRSGTRAARAPRRPCARGQTTRRTRDRLLQPEDRTMNVTPQAAESATNHDDPRHANVAQRDPLVQPHSSNARRPGTPAGKASTYPAPATGAQGVEASLSSPWCPTRMKLPRPPPTSPGRNRLQQKKVGLRSGARRAIAAKEKKNQEKDAQPEKIRPKFDYSDLRNPHQNFTPLFGEVAKFRTLTEKEEQQSRDGDENERCLPQNT